MLYFLLSVFLIFIDLFTKRMAVNFLKDGTIIEVINGVLRFNYVENTGAAFGILKNMRWFFILITFILVIVLIHWFEKSFFKNNFLRTGMVLIISGAIGNLIDRVLLGYVVDFIDFYLIKFPVFNVADCFICIGALIISIHYIFFEKDTKNEQREKD